MSRPRSHRAGYSLLELVAVVAILGLIVAVATPAWSSLRSRSSLRVSAHLLVGELRLLRSDAIRHGRSHALRLRLAGDRWIVRPQQRNAVGNFVDSGPERPFLPDRSGCRIGFPPGGVPDPSSPSKRLSLPSQAIRLATPDLISFSEIGGSTSGSIFLTEPGGRCLCLRLYGGNGRPHLLLYEPSSGRWLQEP